MLGREGAAVLAEWDVLVGRHTTAVRSSRPT
jgi:hypothetical protein